MRDVGREPVNTNPEPRVKPKLPDSTVKMPHVPRAQHIANQYQNNKNQVFSLGYFEHSKEGE